MNISALTFALVLFCWNGQAICQVTNFREIEVTTEVKETDSIESFPCTKVEYIFRNISKGEVEVMKMQEVSDILYIIDNPDLALFNGTIDSSEIKVEVRHYPPRGFLLRGLLVYRKDGGQMIGQCFKIGMYYLKEKDYQLFLKSPDKFKNRIVWSKRMCVTNYNHKRKEQSW